MRVVQPVLDLPIGLPPGRRDRYPADPAAVATLVARQGIRGACDRLVTALAGMG
jgi:hypothetical protein